MTRPEIPQAIASLLWFTENEILTKQERARLDDAVMVLRDLAFTHIGAEEDDDS